VVTPGGTSNIHKMFHFCSGSFEHIAGYRGLSVVYAGFRLLTIVVLDEADEVLHITPQERIQRRKVG